MASAGNDDPEGQKLNSYISVFSFSLLAGEVFFRDVWRNRLPIRELPGGLVDGDRFHFPTFAGFIQSCLKLAALRHGVPIGSRLKKMRNVSKTATRPRAARSRDLDGPAVDDSVTNRLTA